MPEAPAAAPLRLGARAPGRRRRRLPPGRRRRLDRRHVHRHARRARAGRTSARARSTTSSAGSPKPDGRPHAPRTISVPPSSTGVEPVRSVRTPAALEYEFTAGGATTRFLTGIQEKKILGERAPGGKVYVPVPRRRPAARRAHLRAGRAAPRRHAHQLLRRQRGVLRPGHGDPVHVGPDPARRRRPADHAPHPGVPGGGRPHRHAGRGRVGRRRRHQADAREHPVLPPERRARRRRSCSRARG